MAGDDFAVIGDKCVLCIALICLVLCFATGPRKWPRVIPPGFPGLIS